MNRSAPVTAADVAGCYLSDVGTVELTLEGVRRGPGVPARPGRPVEYVMRLRAVDTGQMATGTWTTTGTAGAEITWRTADGAATTARVEVDRRTRDLTGTVTPGDGAAQEQKPAGIQLVRKPC